GPRQWRRPAEARPRWPGTRRAGRRRRRCAGAARGARQTGGIVPAPGGTRQVALLRRPDGARGGRGAGRRALNRRGPLDIRQGLAADGNVARGPGRLTRRKISRGSGVGRRMNRKRPSSFHNHTPGGYAAMTESVVFLAAVQLPAPDRAAYLDEACRNNPELRRRVEALLRAHATPDDLPAPPVAAPRATLAHVGDTAAPPPTP